MQIGQLLSFCGIRLRILDLYTDNVYHTMTQSSSCLHFRKKERAIALIVASFHLQHDIFHFFVVC